MERPTKARIESVNAQAAVPAWVKDPHFSAIVIGAGVGAFAAAKVEYLKQRSEIVKGYDGPANNLSDMLKRERYVLRLVHKREIGGKAVVGGVAGGLAAHEKYKKAHPAPKAVVAETQVLAPEVYRPTPSPRLVPAFA